MTKAEEEDRSSSSPPSSPSLPSLPKPSSSALRVTVPSELQGVAYIEVLCQKGKFRKIIKFKNCLLEKYLPKYLFEYKFKFHFRLMLVL